LQSYAAEAFLQKSGK